MSGLVRDLRGICGHDSRSVEHCITCEAADRLEHLKAALSARPAVEGEAEKYRFLRDKAFLCSSDVASDASALFDCHGDEFDRRVEALMGDKK